MTGIIFEPIRLVNCVTKHKCSGLRSELFQFIGLDSPFLITISAIGSADNKFHVYAIYTEFHFIFSSHFL